MPKTIKTKYLSVHRSIILFTTVWLPVLILAQSARKIERRADAAFQKKEYYTAAKLYSAILYDSVLLKTPAGLMYPFQPRDHMRARKIRRSERPYVTYRLAESYRLYNHYTDALPQYEQYLSLGNSRFPAAGLWYGISLLANNEPEKAIAAFNAFLQKYKTEDSLSQKARLGLADADFVIHSRSLLPRALVTKIASAVSADGSNFAMEKMNGSSFWFTSSRHEINQKNEKVYPVKLYSGDLNNAAVEKITGFPVDLNMGTPSVSADGLTLYFTGWKKDAKTPTPFYHIFYATRSSVDSGWGIPVAMPTPVNGAAFNSKQPFITSDKKHLLFASDRKGGYGGYDIWMLNMDGVLPAGTVFNLGGNINTPVDEASPFYDARSGYLYFSSEGRTGMGGMDIYKISADLMTDQWPGAAINLGFPINSVKDDLYFTKDPETDTAYLSSDRASGCCLELFRAVYLPYSDTANKVKQLLVNNSPNNAASDSIATTNKRNAHLMDSINAITIERMRVNYNFASARIRKSDYPQLSNVVQMMEDNPALNILVASFTDCIGSTAANVLLSRKRSESVKAYLIRKGIAPSRINIDFFGKKYFIVACKEGISYNQEKQIANRRSDLMVTTDQHPQWKPAGNETDNFQKTETMPGNAGTVKQIDNANTKGDKNNSQLTNSNRKLNQQKNAVGRDSRDAAQEDNTANNEQSKNKNNRKRQDKGGDIKGRQQDSSGRTAKTLTETSGELPAGKTVDSLHNKIKITELLDHTPGLKRRDVIDEMTRRTPRKSFEVYSTSDSVRVELYDNGVFDYDSVSVIYDKKLVIYQQMLQTNKPIRFYVKLDPDPRKNEMIFFAENLGLTPPNSALMIITDGDNKRTEVNVSSDMEHNAVIYFIKVKK